MASRVVQNHLPCPKCPSSDAYKLYDDGHGHCFSCGTTTQGDLAIEKAPPADDYEKVHKFRPLPEVYHDWPERKLTAPALKKYGVTVVQDPNSKVQAVYPRFDEDGHHIGNKIRYENYVRLFNRARFSVRAWERENADQSIWDIATPAHP